ncbi:MAG: Hsp20/alpha crystallin family protein [Candidatus Solibacter usitatus]|nr:Hsp20/alpha crystallin family protein [Candidatus Solibacter usitatus]
MALQHDAFSNLRGFEDAVTRWMSEPRAARPWSPAVDVIENENELILKADLPDVDLKDIDVRVENQTLTLKGDRKFEREEKNGGYHRIERNYGTFMRSFTLPSSVENDKVSADYKNGVLTVKLPKKEAAKPKQVKVEVKG